MCTCRFGGGPHLRCPGGLGQFFVVVLLKGLQILNPTNLSIGTKGNKAIYSIKFSTFSKSIYF